MHNFLGNRELVYFGVKKQLSLEKKKKGFGVFVSWGGGQMYRERHTGLSIISLKTNYSMYKVFNLRSIVDCNRDNIFFFFFTNRTRITAWFQNFHYIETRITNKPSITHATYLNSFQNYHMRSTTHY